MEKREAILKEYIPDVLYDRFPNEWSGGTKRFTGVPLEKLEELQTKQLIDLEERQNNSPTVAEFMDIMKRFPKLSAHGYIVTEERPDARTSIEGLEGFVAYGEMSDVEKLLAHADEWNIKPDTNRGGYQVRSWWD